MYVCIYLCIFFIIHALVYTCTHTINTVTHLSLHIQANHSPHMPQLHVPHDHSLQHNLVSHSQTTCDMFITIHSATCLQLYSEEVGTDHVSDHALRFSSDVCMERMYRLSFCRNYETLYPGVGLNGKSS